MSKVGGGLRFLVVGGGSVGLRHVRNLIEYTGVDVALCSSHVPVPFTVNDRPVRVFREYRESFEWEPDAVLVCTAPSRHLHIAWEAVHKTCDIFIEKPISHTTEGVEEMLSVAEERQCVVVMGYNLRFLPSLRNVKKLLEDCVIGKVFWTQVYAGSYLPDWRPGRDYRKSYSARRDEGGGVALDLSHEFDYLLWLFGTPKTVWGSSSRLSDLEIDTEDSCEARIYFENEVRAFVHLNYFEKPNARWCTITGERGKILWDLCRRRLDVFSHWEPPRDPSRESDFDLDQTYVAEMEHLIRVVRRQVPPLVDGWDGLNCLRVALSARNGTRVD